MGSAIIKSIFPDKEKQKEAELKLLEAQQSGAFKELEVRMSAINWEARSADPWTSRARPTFLYVIYIMILLSIPMGVLYCFSPETAHAIEAGVKGWLNAIPSSLWNLFGAGYLGYSASRSYDKKQSSALHKELVNRS